jgi:hypothetical protein
MKRGHETLEDFEAFLSQTGLEPATHGLVRIFPFLVRLSNEALFRLSRHFVTGKLGQ